MKTVHFFAFYLHNLPKITDFSPRSSTNPKNTKSLHFDRDGWGCSAASPFFRCAIYLLQMRNLSSSDAQSVFFRCAISLFQMRNQSSSDTQSVFFKFPLPHLWVFVPAFIVIYAYFYNEVVQYRLNPHGYCLDFVSAVDCNAFQPRIQNFQARKILVSSRENFMLNMRIHFIPYENEVHSSKEWSVFS